MTTSTAIRNTSDLEERLSRPSDRTEKAFGAGSKMKPSLARMTHSTFDAYGPRPRPYRHSSCD